MNKILLALAVVGALAVPAGAAPLLSDVADSPARPAIESLVRQGVVEGYPDGMFRGSRAASRYEVALMIARVAALEEKAHGGFATKAELDELSRMVKVLQQEMGGLETRTGGLETEVQSLDARVRGAR